MQRVGSCSASRAGFGSLAVVFTNDHHLRMDSADTAAVVFVIPAAALAVRLMGRLCARGNSGRNLQLVCCESE